MYVNVRVKIQISFLRQHQIKKAYVVIFVRTKKTGSLQLGLADAIDASNFNVKLESLKSVWDSMLPRF